MKILITGGAGYIGSKLVSHLFNKPKFWDPLEITVYDNLRLFIWLRGWGLLCVKRILEEPLRSTSILLRI